MSVVLFHKISYIAVPIVLFVAISRATRNVRGGSQQNPINLSHETEEVHVAICTDSLEDERPNLLLDRAGKLGYTTHWLNCSDAFGNSNGIRWGNRLKHYQEFVEDLLEPSGDSRVHDPLVVFVDGYDVLAEGSASEAAARFEDYGTPVVLSCVAYQYPPTCEAYSRISLSGCVYPSGGAYMGRATGLRKLFQQGGKFDAETDDQCWLFSAAYEHLSVDKDYKLDKDSHLFMSYTTRRSWLWSYAVRQGRHKITAPGVEHNPTFIHLDSSHASKKVMRKLEECLPGSTESKCNRQVGGW
eukprot:CAMPEP_0169091410 /NCGR_PEP_ID=MMETSP1015-20121227/16346_1 /TAXON_ID=342587 /ORGANISM="Karlodinium micrum, Strain CCMP2283" /LENGTH=298 /DNA_ID=CAMNT_0009151897 /DNA_START=48 /DNA_END=941 /DNA_ORIENTATION=-